MGNEIYNQESSEQLDLSNIKPYVMKDMVLMAPGVWNGVLYNSESVIKAFSNTDWNDREVTSVFVDHSDGNILTWVGRVANQKLIGDRIFGDVLLYNKDAAVNVAVGKMRCGISPKVSGQEENQAMNDFKFLNFSIVTNPACKKAYINLSEQEDQILKDISAMEAERKRRGMSVSEFYAVPRDPPSSSALPIFDAAHVRNALARFNQTNFQSPSEKEHAKAAIKRAAKKFGIASNLEDDSFSIINNVERRLNLEMAEEIENKLSNVQSEKVEELAKKEPKTELEMSDSELVGMISSMDVEELSEWNSFVSKKRSENPKVSLKEMATSFNKQKEMFRELSNLSETEILEQINKLSSVLKKKKGSCALPKEEKMSDELNALREQIKELNAKVNEPDKKTVKSLSTEVSSPQKAFANGSQELIHMLKSNLK